MTAREAARRYGAIGERATAGFATAWDTTHRDWLMTRCREKDFTLRGLVAELAERGLTVDYRSVWEFVHAEDLSFKKNRARRVGACRSR